MKLCLLLFHFSFVYGGLYSSPHQSISQPGFGKSFLRNSRLCHQWSCINNALNLGDSLPREEELIVLLQRILPKGSWQHQIHAVVNNCYNDRKRRYTNTCPGQAIIHCVVDQLNDYCPDEYLRKNDACAPLNSLAGTNLMFVQSRYIDLENNLKYEVRPSWFLKNYFSKNCCNLPAMFNTTLLHSCGFDSMINYYEHKPNSDIRVLPPQILLTTEVNKEKFTENNKNPMNIDPLDCCDMSTLIQPSWREQCGFKTTWQGQDRLVIESESSITTETPITSTEGPKHKDLVIVPQSCEKETCVFNKIGVITNNSINFDIFIKFLDNLTNSSPVWTKAKARVITTCLTKPLKEYDAECEINKLLSCTFDVLTENCPFTKNNSCKHSKEDKTCQVSSSKYRPKKRRDICLLPELQNNSLLTILSECGVNSISKVEMMTPNVSTKTKKNWFFKTKCQDLTPSTSCLLNKMGTLNKYGFIDYFQMKDKIRQLTNTDGFSNWLEVYLSAFNNMPLYRQHCNSAKKFLNVVDTVLMTCPISKRKQTQECNNLFANIHSTPTFNSTTPETNLANILKHYHFVFFPILNHTVLPRKTQIFQKPIYNYGLLNTGDAPPVDLVTVKPTVKIEQRPLVLLPVYMRIPNTNLVFRPNNRLWRGPTLSNKQQNVATISPISTTPVSTISSISTTPVSTTSIFTSPFSTTSTIKPTFTLKTVDLDLFKPDLGLTEK